MDGWTMRGRGVLDGALFYLSLFFDTKSSSCVPHNACIYSLAEMLPLKQKLIKASLWGLNGWMDGLCVGEGFWMEGWFRHAIVRL